MRNYSSEVKDLIFKLLQKNPLFRPTATEALSHPWFREEICPVRDSINLNKFLTENRLHSVSPNHQMDLEMQKIFGSPPLRPINNPLVNVAGNQESIKNINNSNDGGDVVLIRGTNNNNGTQH